MKHYKLGERYRSWKRAGFVLLVLLVVAAAAGASALQQKYNQNLQAPSASQKNVVVTIPSGSTVQEIGKKLEDLGLIKASWAFEWFVRTHDARDRLQAGTYNLRPNQGVAEIVTLLTQGKVATDLVTILPSQRLDQIRSALINNGGFTEAEVTAGLNPELYADHPALADLPAGANLEGYLYPDSYQKTENTKVSTIIRASLDEMAAQLTPQIRDAFKAQGLTIHEGVILASIVEQEVNEPKDKPIVAQVFLLRKERGIQLGSDVTAFYGAIKDGAEPTVFHDSPYNTRLYSGMPPGAISNVSANSLKAVAEPSSTDYVFFVAGDDGKTYFSHTVEEHEALTAQHCKKLCG